MVVEASAGEEAEELAAAAAGFDGLPSKCNKKRWLKQRIRSGFWFPQLIVGL